MEDLTGKIAELLSNPEVMSRLQSFSSLLATNNEPNAEQTHEQTPPETKSLDSGMNFDIPPELFQMVMKLLPVLSSLKNEDKYTRFLNSLRPLLSEKRQKKLDNSAGILKLMRILPFLKNQGLF